MILKRRPFARYGKEVIRLVNDEPNVHLNKFSGPLELLLKLIQKNKMNIYDIKISAITSQYLKYVHQLKSLDLDIVGDFLIMATKLMAIKSKMLLPKRKTNDDESDPRKGLVHQLVVYKKYKRAANQLQDLELNRKQYYTRPAIVPSKSNHLINLHDQLSSQILGKVFQNVIKRRVEQKPISENVTEWHYSVKRQGTKILQAIKLRHGLKLHALFLLNNDLEELITNFLVLLDLIKEQRIRINCDYIVVLNK